jgi:hypothetical protein
MRSILRNLFLAQVVIAAMTMTTSAVLAATTSLNVPFGFTVNGKICPAGRYEVNLDHNRGVISLRAIEAPASYMWGAGPGDPSPNSSKVVLQFDHEGNGYALRAIEYGPMTTPRLDKKTKQREQAPARTVEGF